MSDYTPVNTDTGAITLTAGAIITGGLLVCSSGVDDTVVHTTHSTLGRRPIGIAAQDAPSGGRVPVYPLPGYIHSVPVENGATTVTGDWVVASTTPGRISSTTIAQFSTTNTSVQVIGTVVRATTGSTSAVVGVGVSRFIGW